MGYLRIPNNLDRDPSIRIMLKKAEEPLPLMIGRLLLIVDYHARHSQHFYHHATIEEVAQWHRFDLTFSEILEAASLARIEGKLLRLTLPKKWLNLNNYRLAGSLRAATFERAKNGKFVKKEKPPAVKLDAEGNEI